MGTVLTKNYSLPPLRRREILRYMGCREETIETAELIDHCLTRCDGIFAPRVVFAEFDISQNNSFIDLGFATVQSKDLAKDLDGCESVILFCATVGHAIDRLIAKNSRLSPAKALCLQAIGAEAIEALCECFCSDMACEHTKKGYSLRPRFSAGYGDLTLELQRDIFRVLECEKRVGVALNESLLMSPSKSVTAIIGVGRGDAQGELFEKSSP